MMKALAVLLSWSLVANAADLPAKSNPHTLHVRLTEIPVNLDWNGSAGLGEAPIIVNVAEGLFGYEYPSRRLVPMIAESVQKSKDLKEYTFKIRKGTKWSDGRPVYAQDFVDAWLKVLYPQATSFYYYYLFDIENGEAFHGRRIQSADSVGIKATSDDTLVVKLKTPQQNWEANTAFWPFFPARKDLEEKHGAKLWRPGFMVSTGPYIYESYEPGKKAILKPNPHYVRSKTNVDEIDFEFGISDEDALKKFNAGEFQFLYNLSFNQIEKLSKKTEPIKLFRHHVFSMNTDKFPMSNKEFRLAILSAINPDELISKGASPLRIAKTLIPPPMMASDQPTTLPFNPVAAKEHLKNSGILLTKNLIPRILTAFSEPYLSIGKMIQKQLKENLGMETELAALQSNEYKAYYNLGDYNATITTWTAKALSPQDFLLPYAHREDLNKPASIAAQYTAMIQEGMQASDSKKATQAFHRAQEFISSTEAMVKPLYFEDGAFLKSSKIKNLYFNHQGIPVLREVILTP